MTLSWTDKATKDYRALGEYLLVKFLDGNIKKQNEDGSFKRSETGMPVQPEFGGYNERYFRSIVEDAGERLRVPEIK